MSTNIIAFVIVLGVLIFFHELGHFLIARLFGVGVEKFSLGFGPKLFGKIIGETEYRVSAIPLGGYVKMVGEEPGSEIEPADLPRSFNHKKIYQKMLIVAAGPFFNLLLAVLIFFALFSIGGVYDLKPSFGDVSKGAPAEAQGLKKGDLVLAIDQKKVGTWDEMAQIISDSGGRPLRFTLSRGDSVIDIDVTPKLDTTQDLFGEDVQRYMIGVANGGDYSIRDIGVGGALVESVRYTYRWAKLTVVSVVKLIRGTLSRKTLGGPIMIAQMAGQQVREGVESFLFFIALLSVNLAIINFIPIPVLDGGHLLFFAIEAVIRRPLNTRMREVAQQIGIFILVFLMIYVFYNDINRLIFS
jgi:regulator of sigma E protease